MNNQNDVLLPTTLDIVIIPLALQTIGIEQENEEFINIVQLTNNHYDESSPQISGNNVVWQGYDGNDTEIFLYNGKNTIQLSDNNYGDETLQISGNNVVWQGYDGNDTEIFLYNGKNTIQLSNNNYGDFHPQISGNNVVWWRSDNNYNQSEIFLYNGKTTIQLTDNNYRNYGPKISGNNVVWQGYDGNDYEIYLYDGITTIQLTDNSYDDIKPQISGNNIVWRSDNGDGSFKNTDKEEEIYLYDGTTTIQLTDNSYNQLDYSSPQISGKNIVWYTYSCSGFHTPWCFSGAMYLYDGTTTIQISDSGDDPQISGNNVVWSNDDGNDSEIFLYDGNNTIQLTNNSYDDFDPQISGDNVVFWSGEFEDDDFEIFLATLPSDLSESTPVILSPSIFINDVPLVEGDEGNTDVTFTISIAQASNQTITVDYSTIDGTAIAGEDYIATNGSLEFVPGETEKTITVEVIGDTEVEETEIFTVNLSNATNAVTIDGQGNAVLENDDLSLIEFYGFRNITFETDTHIFVGEEEKDAILANSDFNQTFSLDNVTKDGAINSAFVASVTSGVDLVPFYRLRSLQIPGTYLFVSTEEYNSIFIEGSNQNDKWVKEGLDAEGIDLPEFHLYGVGAHQGIEFHRFQNIDNNTFLFAGSEETNAILNNPNLSGAFTHQGIAFESFI